MERETITYQGFTGSVDVALDGHYFGQVEIDSVLMLYTGQTKDELKANFRKTVDTWLLKNG